VVSQAGNNRSVLVNPRVLYLCVAFIAWSVLGLHQLEDVWVVHVKWWGLLVYVLAHLALAATILRTAGVRFWSSAVCVLGLLIGRDAYLTLFVFSTWKFGGFA
jgi:hypothetical protein